MIRPVLIIALCLLACAPASADEPTMSARKLAETTLLAEWVGQAEEQFTLGNVYYKGDGVPRDYAEAARWYRLAAEQGVARSQHMMGVIYERGDGVPQDPIEAVGWYRRAAGQGYLASQFELGIKYANGEGVPQNYAEAYVWFSLAAAAGHQKARKERDSFARKLSREEIMDAQRRATQLFEEIQQAKTDE